jgi:hypothetical protein
MTTEKVTFLTVDSWLKVTLDRAVKDSRQPYSLHTGSDWLEENQQAVGVLRFKRMKQGNVLPEEMFNLFGRTIRATYPDYAGRKSTQCHKRVKVAVLRHQCETVVFGEGPNSKVAPFA